MSNERLCQYRHRITRSSVQSRNDRIRQRLSTCHGGFFAAKAAAKLGNESIKVFAKKYGDDKEKFVYGKDNGKIPERCNCFTAGTKVLTDSGEKNIEDIKVGDKVLSKSEFDENDELAHKEVTGLYTNFRNDIIKLYIGDLLIETTDNHPFWVEDRGWVLADELLAGDKLQRADGSNLTIDRAESVLLDEPVMVYNFTVADFHTYYVTDLGIWVHNIRCDLISPFELVGRQTRDEMSRNQIKKLAKSMQENGWEGSPIKVYIVDGKTIIVDGHHRAAAARQARLKNVPIEYITEEEFKNT